jgi:hypothetical protein
MKTSGICDQNGGIENNAGARANGVHRGAHHRANGQLDVGTDLLRNMIDDSFWHPRLCEVVDAAGEIFLKKCARLCGDVRFSVNFQNFFKIFLWRTSHRIIDVRRNTFHCMHIDHR